MKFIDIMTEVQKRIEAQAAQPGGPDPDANELSLSIPEAVLADDPALRSLLTNCGTFTVRIAMIPTPADDSAFQASMEEARKLAGV